MTTFSRHPFGQRDPDDTFSPVDNAAQAVATEGARLVSTDGREYPLLGGNLRVRVVGGHAFTTLEQEFANPHTSPLEVRYLMPLPADGVVLGYDILIGDRRIHAGLRRREEAKQAYTQALAEGRTAGLLEQERSDTFTQSLGNIPAGTPVKVTIEVLHPLTFVPAEPKNANVAATEDSGESGLGGRDRWRYRFPTVVGIRYSGSKDKPADADDVVAARSAQGTPARMGLDLLLPTQPNRPQYESRTHTLVASEDEQGLGLSFAEEAALDRDVVIDWTTEAPTLGVQCLEGTGLPGDDGRYGVLTVVPPAQRPAPRLRDLTVLLDSSGSMDGQPLEMAKLAIKRLLLSLEPGDQFEIITFGSRPVRLLEGWTDVTKANLQHALSRLSQVQAYGATEMLSGLQEAFRSERQQAQRQVVLVTDGHIDFEDAVVREVATNQDVRLHVIGVGSAVNRALTESASRAGRGMEVLISTPSDAVPEAARLLQGLRHPLLTNVRIEGSALTGAQLRLLPDVFAGKPLTTTVEFSREGGTLTVKGCTSDGEWEQQLTIPSLDPSTLRGELPVGAIHGRSLVSELETHGGHDGERDQEVERIALRHRIVSRLTSLVAISDGVMVEPGSKSIVARIEVEVPFGVSAAMCGVAPVMSLRIPRFIQPILPSDGIRLYADPEMSDFACSLDDQQLEDWLGITLPVVRISRCEVGGRPSLVLRVQGTDLSRSSQVRSLRGLDRLKKLRLVAAGLDVTARIRECRGRIGNEWITLVLDLPKELEGWVGRYLVVLRDSRKGPEGLPSHWPQFLGNPVDDGTDLPEGSA